MNEQKEVLQAFLSAKLSEQGLSLDQNSLNELHRAVRLSPLPSQESQETRAITQKIDREGKHSAQSFKLYNITQFSTADVLSFVGQYAGIAMFEDTVKKLIYAFVMLIIDFYPKLKVDFTEQEAKIIYAIAQLKKTHFTSSEVLDSYQLIFPEVLALDKLENSMDFLVECTVVERTAAQTYELREKIKNLRR